MTSDRPLYFGTTTPCEYWLFWPQLSMAHVEGGTSDGLRNAIAKPSAMLYVPLGMGPTEYWKLSEKPLLVLHVALVMNVCCRHRPLKLELEPLRMVTAPLW